MGWLIGSASGAGAVAAKAALMFATAVIGLRIGERRTLAQHNVIDVVVAVALGAIIGRSAVASDQSYLTGAAALVTLLVLHRAASLARMHPRLRGLFEHRVRVVVVDGRPQPRQLRRCGLLEQDLHETLRRDGYYDLGQVRFVLYEADGEMTVIPADAPATLPLVDSFRRSRTPSAAATRWRTGALTR